MCVCVQQRQTDRERESDSVCVCALKSDGEREKEERGRKAPLLSWQQACKPCNTLTVVCHVWSARCCGGIIRPRTEFLLLIIVRIFIGKSESMNVNFFSPAACSSVTVSYKCYISKCVFILWNYIFIVD